MPTMTIPGTLDVAVTWHRTGLTGTLGLRITNNQGGLPLGRTTSLVSEYPAGSGVYQATIPDFGVPGIYTIVWDDFTRFDAVELTVAGTVVAGLPAEFDTPAPTFAAFDQPSPVLTGSYDRPTP